VDTAALKALEDAGYLVERDAVVLNVTENVQLRANDLSHLVEMCAVSRCPTRTTEYSGGRGQIPKL